MEFVKFKRAVHAQFNQLAAGADMLFLTNVDKDALWDCYLNSFPEEERQSHNCNNCKHYIRHYGRVVAIKDNKVVTMWENLQLDEPYATVARNLDALVKSKPVVDVFITRDYELGLMDSLPRRHAALEDITVNNVIFANRDAKKVMAGNIFEELAADTKVNPKKFDKLTEISIDDFIANVVPTVTNIEVLMESRLSNNLVTLTAPVNKDAKNLFKWPNNFAWTYNGGVADSIKEKVRAAGGQTEGFLRCSLAWSNYDDLDLHVVEPNNLEIYYSNRIGRSGGKLDVDENAGYGKTRKPVENIIWVDERKMLKGNYTVYVNNFCCRESVDTGFTLEIEYNGEVRQFVYDKPVKHKENVMVAEITYSKSKGIQIRELIPSTSNSSIGIWNIDTNKFHKVNVMMMSPNYWDEQGIGNKHYFFMLDDCKNPEPVRGFFNEYLNSERKVFEVLADKMKTPYQEHQLSGLGFSSTMRNSVIVKVDGTFSRTLKVNF